MLSCVPVLACRAVPEARVGKPPVAPDTPLAVGQKKQLPECNNRPPDSFTIVGMGDSNRNVEDERLFAEWSREHGRSVRGFLLAMVRRHEVADDLCQEVFCRAWQGRKRYREQGNARAYLLRIADRLACDHARRTEPLVHLNDEGWKMYAPTESASEPAQALSVAEETGRLAVALGELSSMQRRVLLMRYYGQLSFAEIAAAIDCPVNTTLSHCRRGLETLRRLLVDK